MLANSAYENLPSLSWSHFLSQKTMSECFAL